MLNIYKVMICTELDYRTPIYLRVSLLNPPKNLNPIQNTCIRFSLRDFPTSPIASLEALSSTSPLHVRHSILSTHLALRIITKSGIVSSTRDPIRLFPIQIHTSTNTISLTSTEIPSLTALP